MTATLARCCHALVTPAPVALPVPDWHPSDPRVRCHRLSIRPPSRPLRSHDKTNHSCPFHLRSPWAIRRLLGDHSLPAIRNAPTKALGPWYHPNAINRLHLPCASIHIRVHTCTPLYIAGYVSVHTPSSPAGHQLDRATLRQVPHRHCISLAAASLAGDDIASAECVHFLPCHAMPRSSRSREHRLGQALRVWHKTTIIYPYLLVLRTPVATTPAMF